MPKGPRPRPLPPKRYRLTAEERDAAAESLQGMVAKMARDLCAKAPRGTWAADYGEVFAEGMAGVATGLERFDKRRNCRPATFVWYWVWARWSRRFQRDKIAAKGKRTLHYQRWGEDDPDGRDPWEPADPKAVDPGDHAANGDLAAAIERSLRVLHPRAAEVVRLRMRGHTLEEVARQHGVTKERVRQIEARAHERLRAELWPVAAELGVTA